MINVFVNHLTPRIRYAFSLIFETLLKNEVAFFTNVNEYKHSVGFKINYSNNKELGGLYLQAHGLLNESNLHIHEPKVIHWEGEVAFYPVSDSFIPFDLFAASFYLVTRYEEYLPAKRDSHNRYLATESFAFKNGFLEIALVNRWALKLAQIIEANDGKLKFCRTNFIYLPTIDVDNAWAFQNKGITRTIFSIFKDVLSGRFAQLKKRLKVIAHIEKDSYDNYDFLIAILEKFRFKPMFFFLLNEFGKYDRSLSYKNVNFRQLINMLAKSGKIGLHPSYASNKNKQILQKEINRFVDVTGKNVEQSRQHFLKIVMPDTYRKLISLGVKYDYSMGYASHPGFRASIATPYYFYDVAANKATEFEIVPFQVMDVTLQQYQRLTPDGALNKIEKLMNETYNVGGTFVSLWHNESLSNEGKWEGWRNVYTEMTQMAFEKSDGKSN